MRARDQCDEVERVERSVGLLRRPRPGFRNHRETERPHLVFISRSGPICPKTRRARAHHEYGETLRSGGGPRFSVSPRHRPPRATRWTLASGGSPTDVRQLWLCRLNPTRQINRSLDALSVLPSGVCRRRQSRLKCSARSGAGSAPGRPGWASARCEGWFGEDSPNGRLLAWGAGGI